MWLFSYFCMRVCVNVYLFMLVRVHSCHYTRVCACVFSDSMMTYNPDVTKCAAVAPFSKKTEAIIAQTPGSRDTPNSSTWGRTRLPSGRMNNSGCMGNPSRRWKRRVCWVFFWMQIYDKSPMVWCWMIVNRTFKTIFLRQVKNDESVYWTSYYQSVYSLKVV